MGKQSHKLQIDVEIANMLLKNNLAELIEMKNIQAL